MVRCSHASTVQQRGQPFLWPSDTDYDNRRIKLTPRHWNVDGRFTAPAASSRDQPASYPSKWTGMIIGSFIPPCRQHRLQTSPNTESLGLQLRNARDIRSHDLACLVYKSPRRYTAQLPKGKGDPGLLAFTWVLSSTCENLSNHCASFPFVYSSAPLKGFLKVSFHIDSSDANVTSPFWRRKGTSTHQPMNFRAFSLI